MPELRAPALLVTVAGWGLPVPHRWPDGPLDDAEWSQLLAQAGQHRVVGLVDAAVASGDLPASPEQRIALGDRSAGVAAGALALDRAALDTTAALAAVGIDHRLLKGPALAHTAYDTPHHRSYGDVDVLVEPGRFGAAVGALVARGGRRAEPERRRGFDERFNKSATILHRTGLEIDLHRTLAPAPFGPLIPIAEVLERSAQVRIGTATVAILEPSAMLAHVCLHAVLSGPVRLMTLRDVAQALPLADPVEVERLARRWSAGAPVASAISFARSTFGLSACSLTEWADGYVRSARDERLMRPFERQGRAALPVVLRTARELDGVAAKAAYLTAIAVPSRAYLQHRSRTRLAFLRRGVTAARRPRQGEARS